MGITPRTPFHGQARAAFKGEKLAFKGVTLIPHISFQAVLTAAVGIADMAGNRPQIGIPAYKYPENLILLLIAWLQGHTVLLQNVFGAYTVTYQSVYHLVHNGSLAHTPCSEQHRKPPQRPMLYYPQRLIEGKPLLGLAFRYTYYNRKRPYRKTHRRARPGQSATEFCCKMALC